MAPLRALLLVSLLCASALVAADVPPITSVAEIRALSPERAASGLPVRITGVVTCCTLPWRVFFIFDGNHGVYINDAPGSEMNAVPSGTTVSVEGVTVPGGYLPVIKASRVEFGGTGSLPAPIPMTAENLYSPSLDSEWVVAEVEVIGLSTRQGGLVLNVRLGGWPMKAFVPAVLNGRELPWELVGRRVRMRAVAATLFNETRQMTGRFLYVPSIDEITAGEAVVPPSTPFPIETDELLRVDRARDDLVRVRGTVLSVEPERCVYLRGARRSIRVDTSRDYGVKAGDLIEADGYPVLSLIRPALNSVAIRRLELQPAPAPREWAALT